MYQKLSIRFWTQLFLNRLSKKLFLISILLSFATITIANQHVFLRKNKQLGMKQLIQAVLTHNPSIEAMQLSWQAAQDRIEQVSALEDPMLSYTFAPETRNFDGQDFGQKIQLSQKLPWFGKLDLRGDNARFKAKASRENIKIMRLQLIEASANAFADWYFIHEALRINLVNQDLWREFQAIAELKYSTGRASKQDALRAEVEQNLLEHQAIILQRKKSNILVQINTLLNQAPEEIIAPPGGLPKPQSLPPVERLRQMAIEIHPEIKKLHALKQASNAQVKLAERNYYPDFNVTAGYNSLWNQDEKRFTVGIGITIPIGQGKRNARLSEKRAHLLALKWKINEKQTAIAGAVQRAYNRVEESRHVLKLYRTKLMPLAEENLHAAKVDYQSGEGGFLDLVSAEKNLIQTQLNHVKAQANYLRHLATLAKRVAEPRLLDAALNISGMSSNHSDFLKGESP